MATYQFFIPCYNEDGECIYILTRRNDDLKTPDWVKFEVNKTHNLKGYSAVLLNSKYLYDPQLTDKHIFVVESWADALSLEELGYNAIALNSTSNINIFLEHVEKNKDLIKDKIFITAGNADTAGRKMNENIENAFKNLELQCHIYIMPQYNDFNEFLVNNRDVLEESIKGFISSVANNNNNNNNNSYIVEEICKPIHFDDYDALPKFPIDSLVGWLRDHIEAVAESTQTPADLGAVLTFAAIATATQGKFIVGYNADWIEPLNIYVVAIMKPSERKSPVFRHILEPVTEYENLENERLKPEIEKNRTEKRILEEKIINQGKIASNPKYKNHDEAEIRAMELSEEMSNFKELKPLHLIADDITPERCAALLAENNGTLSILSSETALFEIIKGRYSNNGGSNFEVFLKGYSGDEIRVDRQREVPIYVNRPALTIGITVQPNVINGMMQNSNLRGRGLTARFLYCVPCSFVGNRKINPQTIPEYIKKEYYKILKRLLDISLPEKPSIIKLSQAAKLEFDKFIEELEPRLIGDLSFVSEWAGKLAGNILRISGLLYLADIAKDNSSRLLDGLHEIPDYIMINAITIGRYFIEHAIGAFGMMGTDVNTENAKILLRWMHDKDIKEFKKNEAYRALRYICSNTKAVLPALEVLVEYNYIVMKDVPYEGVGRKPEGIYIRIN